MVKIIKFPNSDPDGFVVLRGIAIYPSVDLVLARRADGPKGQFNHIGLSDGSQTLSVQGFKDPKNATRVFDLLSEILGQAAKIQTVHDAIHEGDKHD